MKKTSVKIIDLNKSGISYFAQKKYDEAIQIFQSLIDLQPDYTDAYYNLGLSLVKVGRRQEAMHVYDALIALSPDHLGGRFQLGRLWMERHKENKALEHFLAIMRTYPDHVETLINIATCYLKLGDLTQAKSYYLKALHFVPMDVDVLFNLGVINRQQGYPKKALEFYSQAVKSNPHFHDAQHNLAVLFLDLRDYKSALVHFRAALNIEPNNETARHMIHVLTRDKKISASPTAYITSLFDSYAEHYDTHLTKSLHYQVPQQLLEIVKAFKNENTKWNILDLGCGTGLSGELFKGYSSYLIGVDLSKKMLEIAEKKKIYEELIESDILVFLKEKKHVYDLIIAGDTLVYFGDLALIFSEVVKALKPSGLFVFNLEISEKENYELMNSGRFSHRERYIEELSTQNHFQILQHTIAPMRTDDRKVVMGHFYLLMSFLA